MAQNVGTLSSSSQIFYGQRVSNSIYLEPTNIEEITDINDLNPNKAIGNDGIPAKLIKAAKLLLSPFLTNIFNNSPETGHCLDDLKIARVRPTPFHKGGSTTELKNYSPISILSTFNKILEILVKKRLLKF